MPIAKQSSGKSFSPIPAGVHQGVCVSIIDIGTQMPSNPQHKTSRKIWITWELPHETIETEEGPKPRFISEKYTLSMHKKGRLLPMLQSWRGTPFTADELKGFDLANLLGRNCQINVVHNPSLKDPTKMFANISAVIPMPKGMPPIAPSGKTLVYDVPEAGTISIPKEVPEWIAKQIQESVEYKERMANSVAIPDETGQDDDKPF
jgi:hypothetical protein